VTAARERPASEGLAGRFVDLHAHSTASDGSKPPRAVVAAARAVGLSAMALTDHDTMAGVNEAMEAGRTLGVRVVPGVELSAMEGDREVHVLGLHIEHVNALEDTLTTLRDRRFIRAQLMVEKLNALGVPITFDAVLRQAGGGAIGRPHIARVLISEGWARDSRDAFDRYLGANKPAFVPKHRLTVAEAIDLIHAGGGLAVLAHPGSEGRRDAVERYAAMGLDGLEVKHPGHSSEDTSRLGALADYFGLVWSGGSDWHGASEGQRTLGVMQVPGEWLDRQDARVAARRGGERVGS
jgi:predicted metal-dependent phosphoesterase TrpH